jgi:hypothetical protein
MRHLILYENFSTNESKEFELDSEAEKKFREEYTIDGKYVFDQSLSDQQKEALLLKKLEANIKKNNLNREQAKKLKATWEDNMKKVGVDEFEEKLRRRKYEKGMGGRTAEKIKREIWKGYKQPLMQIFSDMEDILSGQILPSHWETTKRTVKKKSGSGESNIRRVSRM